MEAVAAYACGGVEAGGDVLKADGAGAVLGAQEPGGEGQRVPMNGVAHLLKAMVHASRSLLRNAISH